MKLIHFRGLNCYFNSILSIAASMGVKYEEAFATLWSETEFTYDERCNVYSTKRMIENLKCLGAKLEVLSCASRPETEGNLSLFEEGEFLIAGMDAFFIPWSPIYGALHDPHYFFARKEGKDGLCCFDPTYGRQGMRVTLDEIIPHAFDMCRMVQAPEKPVLRTEAWQEAREIMRSHPQMREKLLSDIRECAHEKQKNAGPLAKYADALMNNRYLYKHYLQNVQQQFFDPAFFSKWEAIKNGLYKASLIKNNENVIKEVCKLLESLLDDEIVVAGQIADAEGFTSEQKR